MPCRNSQLFLEEALDSVFMQTSIRTEVICVNDRSTDRTAEILNAYGKKIKRLDGEGRGANCARNMGLRFASGKYVKFLDSDDRMCPNALVSQVALSEQHSDTDRLIYFGNVKSINSAGEELGEYGLNTRGRNLVTLDDVLEFSPITSSPLHRRTFLLEVGGMNETIPSNHEHDLHFRLVLAGIQLRYHDDAIYEYREHSETGRVTGNSFVTVDPSWLIPYVHEQLRMLQRHWAPHPVPEKTLGILSAILWRAGRHCIRCSNVSAARECFRESRRLCTFPGGHIGGPAYRSLTRVLGPVIAERLHLLCRF
jgi:glycosyltransferase involved in cell wall biosynthesis